MTKITASIRTRLDEAAGRYAQLNAALADPATATDSDKLKALLIERSSMSSLIENYQRYQDAQTAIDESTELLKDPELGELAQEELVAAKRRLQEAEADLLLTLAPDDPSNDKNAFIEIRAGTGGSESCLFAMDLLRMYSRWADSRRLKVSTVSSSAGEAGGFREAIVKVEGKGAYGLFKHEAGAHRVQRVPETESQGRIHTSVCTVAVMPEARLKDIGIDNSDLRFDTYRASGAGGQHVNTTDSAVRVTHLPTGIVAECQNDRSQHRNKEQALEMLIARVNNHFRQIHEASQTDARRKMVGSGERNEKIRTYNYPQGRVTDHRVNLTVRRLKEIMEGDLREFHDALVQFENAEKIAQAISQ